MPGFHSSRPLPASLTQARTAWSQAILLSRRDCSAAAQAFLEIARSLQDADEGRTEAITSLRLLALENALDAADAASENLKLREELKLLGEREPALAAGITRLLGGDRESVAQREPVRIIRG
jgi:hypothetical protein